ncbi:Hypothetical protein HVR_LOCUS224 [uncultured virus]|nr:Hypothetical protein HVR_LOCUS224 [uncultured virus]
MSDNRNQNSGQAVISFARKFYIASQNTNNVSSYDDAVRSKCKPAPVVDVVVNTHVNPTFVFTIRAYESTYGSYLYWYVDCDIASIYKVVDINPINNSNDDNGEVSGNPKSSCEVQLSCILSRFSESRACFWGIVADNELIRTILKLLCMSDEELSALCGRTHPTQYRVSLIKILDKLWD